MKSKVYYHKFMTGTIKFRNIKTVRRSSEDTEEYILDIEIPNTDIKTINYLNDLSPIEKKFETITYELKTDINPYLVDYNLNPMDQMLHEYKELVGSALIKISQSNGNTNAVIIGIRVKESKKNENI